MCENIKIEENKSYLKTKFQQYVDTDKLSPKRIILATAIHELLGFSLLTGLWYMCYQLQPIGKIASFFPKHYQTNHKRYLIKYSIYFLIIFNLEH